ncbi:MAG: M16 family metallopeptidase [Gemmataceae bacterium]
MPQEVYHHTFDNGLTLLAERMEQVRSAALNILIPAGCVYDPLEQQGIASVLSELFSRGAGPLDSRGLTEALDNLGVDRGESVGQMNMHFWARGLARNLPLTLELYADIVRRPHLPEDELDAVKALAIQDIQSLEDDPRHYLLVQLRKHHYPPPLGNDRRGTEQSVERLTIDDLRSHYQRLFGPRGAIIAVAGNIDWEVLKEQVGRLFGDWQGGVQEPLTLGPAPAKQAHIPKDTTQTQIGIAYASVPVGHPDYYQALGAVNVLSGGMSARLFTEVREKHGLCYAISAGYETFKDRASVICYAGTTNERAQKTLDLTLRELRRLSEGIEAEEVERVQAGLKSSLIMQQESTAARANALTSDWYFLGRVRTLDEIQAAVDALTPQTIIDHLHRCPAQDFTIVTLGPKALACPN